jgi:hypothetical protein
MVNIHPYLAKIMMLVDLKGEMEIVRSPYINYMQKGIY